MARGTLTAPTSAGGDYGLGVVFRIDPSGAETVLHSFAGMLNGSNMTVFYAFTGGNDGGTPASDLVFLNGVLYGTTLSGGPGQKGTVYNMILQPEAKAFSTGSRAKAMAVCPEVACS